MPTSPDARPVDEMMDALADDRRRRVLFDLLERDQTADGPVPIVERDDDVDPVSHLVAMKYTHLPRPDVYDYIDWDRSTHRVQQGPAFDQIRPFLVSMRDREDELPVECP